MIRPLDIVLWHNSVTTWLVALGVSVVTMVCIQLLLYIVRTRVAAFAARSAMPWDDVVVHALAKTRKTFVLAVAVFAGSSFLALPPRLGRAIGVLTAIVVLLQLGLWFSAGLSFWLTGYTKRQLEHDRAVATTVSAMGFAAKLLAWIILFLVGLDTAGVNVTALVAGLGIGGIAVALAAQNILGDVFSSLSIIVDKPFVLGDFIRVDDMLGNVEKIGLRSTRIRSLSGERLIFSNGDLLRSRIRNYGSMPRRRVVFEITVTYQTPREKLIAIPGIIRAAVEANEPVRFDRSHFAKYADSSLMFETVYFVLSDDYNTYMDIQQRINFTIHERFEAEGIDFAYPTRTLFLTRTPALT